MARLLCLALLAPGWRYFSFAHGSRLVTPSDDGTCVFALSAAGAGFSFYTARYLLAALMLYELALLPAVEWYVVAHHILTLGAVCLTTDETSMAVLDLSDTATDIVQGFGFLTFFYAGVTAFEYAFVLAYHLHAGQRRAQFAVMAACVAV